MMIRPALAILFSACLAGCGGGGDDVETENLPQEQLGRQVGFEFINTGVDSVDFYLKESKTETPLFDESNKVATNSDIQISQYTQTWSTPTPLTVDIGAIDTNSQATIGTVNDLVTNSGEDYWLISWPDSELGETMLFAGRQESMDTDDKYTVRIFSLEDININILKASSGVLTSSSIKKGEISVQHILDNCIGEMFIDNKTAVDFCGENVTPGKSYLLIIKNNSVLLAAEEK